MAAARTSWKLALIALVLLAGAPACTAGAPAPPARAATQKKAERDPNRERQDEPRHVAPPPAYGNKVVLAQASEADSSG